MFFYVLKGPALWFALTTLSKWFGPLVQVLQINIQPQHNKDLKNMSTPSEIQHSFLNIPRQMKTIVHSLAVQARSMTCTPTSTASFSWNSHANECAVLMTPNPCNFGLSDQLIIYAINHIIQDYTRKQNVQHRLYDCFQDTTKELIDWFVSKE